MSMKKLFVSLSGCTLSMEDDIALLALTDKGSLTTDTSLLKETGPSSVRDRSFRTVLKENKERGNHSVVVKTRLVGHLNRTFFINLFICKKIFAFHFMFLLESCVGNSPTKMCTRV